MAAETYYYYGPADVTLCREHMASQLGEWFPETAEEHKGAMWNYEGWDLDELVTALKASGELSSRDFKALGTRMGPVEDYCQSLH